MIALHVICFRIADRYLQKKMIGFDITLPILGILAFIFIKKSYVVGYMHYLCSPEDELSDFEVIITMTVEIMILFIIGIFVFIILISILKEAELKQKGIYNYIHLPLSSDELRQILAENRFEANAKNYLEYLDNQLTYRKGKSIQLKPTDVLTLLRTIKEVFGVEEILVATRKERKIFVEYQCLKKNCSQVFLYI